jgi:nuclease HARBI1
MLRMERILSSTEQIRRPLTLLGNRFCLLFHFYLANYDIIRTIESAKLWQKLPKIKRTNIKISELSPNFVYTHFRFVNIAQLELLKEGFRIPNEMKASNGSKFTADELLLCGLYRLHYPNRFYDIGWVEIFGFDDATASKCFSLFLKFMIDNWSYLLLDNLTFRIPYFYECTLAIHRKLASLDVDFPLPHEPHGMRICGFIDNTIVATARPGSGPVKEGEGSARKSSLIQKTFYNGWKKTHGLKFQTLDLPNGMNAHVAGPFSCRRNDLYTLRVSKLNEKLKDLQRGNLIQCKVYGDSAYALLNLSHVRARPSAPYNTVQHTNAMSSLRECIEWNYSDLKQTWKFVHYSKNLRLLDMDVAP